MLVLQLLQLNLLGIFLGLVLLRLGEEILADHDTFQRWACFHGSILHVSGFVTEDGTEEFLFRCRVRFTLWCNLTDQDISFLNPGTDADDTVLVEVLGRFLRNVRDVVG